MKWCTIGVFFWLFVGWCRKTDLKTVILLSRQVTRWETGKINIVQDKNATWGSMQMLHEMTSWKLLGGAQSFRYASNSSLFDPAGCSWCHLPESSLHQTANQRQESVWMSVNHFSKMGYNLSPLITASMGRVTHCWPSPLNMLTVCHQLTHLSIAM